MKSKIKLMSLLGMAVLLQSCGLKDWANDSVVNDSALYDPPTVTLIEGKQYEFVEGVLTGRKKHKFHSDYSYLRAITIGNK
jgi:hypothetical protein|tara:strand:+ start:476 stop:718 length:243 start_codon:yes stop_codon:yes gene_type:complete